MINSIKGGELVLRKLGRPLSFSLLFHLLVAAFLPIPGFGGSLILNDHFKLVFGFSSFSCASIGLELEIQTFCTWCCQCTHQGGDGETKWFVPCFICVMTN
jgi:hypothetical protein